jgi:hypothetical protein
MVNFFATPDVLPFSVAFGIMLGLLLIEIIANLVGGNPLDHFIDAHLDMSMDMHAHVDAGVDAGHLHAHGLDSLLAWFHFGRVPVMLIFSLLLAGFGAGGIVMQSLCLQYMGAFAPPIIAIPAGIAMAFAAARLGGSGLALILPKDETSIVSRSQFVGQLARVVQGTAQQGLCAEACLTDAHGQTHYFRVMPAPGEDPMPQGTEVLILSMEEDYFFAIRSIYPSDIPNLAD